MLYALIDYSVKNRLGRISSEEILGEVKISTPKFKEKYNKIYAKKILKKINEHNVENIILNRELSENKGFCRLLEESKKYIITGKRISKVLLNKIVNEIAKYTRYPKEKMNILLLMNEYSLENIDLIEYLSKEIKELTVLSRNYTKYERAATKLFDNYGYLVKLYSNESINEFKRANIIINLDFKEEEFQKINFARNSIVISLNEKINKIRKGFNGIIINDIDISGMKDAPPKYRPLAICEAKIYKPLRKIKENERFFNTEKFIINGYIGKRGKITEEEFERFGKNFSNLLDKQKMNA